MGDQTSEVEDLERILTDTSAEPIKLSYAAIKYITKNFAQEIGDGGFGVVYLGSLQNRMVAVKKLLKSKDFSDKKFLDEVACLKKVSHRNIVRFLGYCADTQGEIMELEGKYRVVEVQQRLLCFEYVPNGNLHQYIKDKTHGYEWNVRYKIIKGICQGLQHIHQEHINHLDLKPANVLLGANMEPKITDFGVSRHITEEQRTMVTENIFGTLGYVAPEFIDKRQISFKSDIFSLGVIIINILTGHTGCILEKWHETIDAACPQMKRCIEIAQLCVERDPHKRPTTDEIIHRLNETEIMIENDPPIINEPRNDPGSSLHQVVQRFKALSVVQPLREHSRVDTLYTELDSLECVLERSYSPGRVPFHLLQFITENFSHEREIGRTEVASLFRGNLRQRSVTVKRLSITIADIDGRIFRNEVKARTLVQHKNIVQFLGYCGHTEQEALTFDGKFIMVERPERLVCFEYLSNGSLSDYISDASSGLKWRERYQIIKGICEGLSYLHVRNIVLVDLKPANILLDDNMVPKIADFGLSRCFDENQTRCITQDMVELPGYQAPEFHDGVITFKTDIYSLGIVITEILTGHRGDFEIENVLESWRTRLGTSSTKSLLEQVRICAKISISCRDSDPAKRPPDMHSIVEMLRETECNC